MADARRFEAVDPGSAPRRVMPLLIGITGPSFSGKSYSAEELAKGIQRIYGGKIYHVDTENDRALELHKAYGGPFDFVHVPFPIPKSPEQYENAIRFCLGRDDCGVIVVDTMSHEHFALLQMMEDYMERKGAGDDADKRDRLLFASQVVPKAQRKRLNELIAHGAVRKDGAKVPMLLLYRAADKTKPGKSKREGGDGKPVHKGWQAETTSMLPYEMTVRFLLPPASDGHPNLTPDTEFEKMDIKHPHQFRGWFKEGFQLNADVGERLARWAKGESASPTTSKPAQAPPSPAGQTDEAAALVVEVKAVLKTHGFEGSKAAAEPVQLAFGSTWAEMTRLPADQLRIGLDALKRNLNGLAAMREPGQDEEEIP